MGSRELFHKLVLVWIVIVFQYNSVLITHSGLWTGNGQPTHLFGKKIGPDQSESEKIWKIFSALGNIALASHFATVIYDIMVSKQ